jgi:hypothetical protein
VTAFSRFGRACRYCAGAVISGARADDRSAVASVRARANRRRVWPARRARVVGWILFGSRGMSGAPAEDSNSVGINGAQGNDPRHGMRFDAGAAYVFPQ